MVQPKVDFAAEQNKLRETERYTFLKTARNPQRYIFNVRSHTKRI